MKLIAISFLVALFLTQVLAKPAEGCLQNYTIAATDSCFSVAAQFKITEAEFYAMNPGLHHSVRHDCDNLDTGKPFCVCMKEPCAVASVPAAPSAVPSEANSTVPAATAVPSGESSASASPSTVLFSTASGNAPVNAQSNLTSSNGLPTASPSTAKTGNSASSLNTAFGAITIGLTLAITTVLL